MFQKKVGEQSIVTFLIHDQPFLCETAIAKGFDFGREKLYRHIHGNINFSLQDGSTIPLNSYILAHNSPVLTALMEEAGELDHDVTDFDPEAVRIFVDACYTGTVEMLSDDTKFNVFSDFVKMAAVFKVDWAKEQCLGFYKRQLPKPSNDFDLYWSYALLALDSVVKYGDTQFLEYLLSIIPTEAAQVQFCFSELLAKTTKRSHLDLVMVMIVEFDLVDEFLKQILTLMAVRFQIPLLDYWLANFNFTLCDKEIVPLLKKALERNFNAGVLYKFEMSLKNDDRKNTDSASEISGDGTLATLARNHWNKIVDSVWPCFKKRPVSS